jgi:hypothetical protein
LCCSSLFILGEAERKRGSSMILPPPPHAFGAQAKERKQLSQVYQPLRLTAIFAGKNLSAILAVEQLLQARVDPRRQSKPGQVLRHFQLDIDQVSHASSRREPLDHWMITRGITKLKARQLTENGEKKMGKWGRFC